MKILYEILNELAYSAKETFKFSCHMKDAEKQFDVLPFVSVNHPSQVYLVTQVSNFELASILKEDFLISLAKQFRRQEFHRSEMDKNTTLVLECARNTDESLDHHAKVQVEDDPYYFRKYVFSYTFLEENRAEEYLQNRKSTVSDAFSYVAEIQSYLFDTDTFTSYKTNHINQPTYTYFSELVTKIPVFPLQITTASKIKSVNAFLYEELQKTLTTNVSALDQFLSLQLDIKEESLDNILTHWNTVAQP